MLVDSCVGQQMFRLANLRSFMRGGVCFAMPVRSAAVRCCKAHAKAGTAIVGSLREQYSIGTSPFISYLQIGSSVLQQPGRTVSSITTEALKTKQTQAAAESYDATRIQVLEGLEPVRKRPGMYIGSTGQRGLHHLVYEVLDNAIDEVQAGHATLVEVELDVGTGWVTVTDNGRGIPTDVHPATGKSALETVLTVLHAGGKFGGESSGYTISGGLHGVGVSVVNALSRALEVTVWRNGKRFQQHFSRGVPQTGLEVISASNGDASRTGTQVRFLYDDTIFAKGASFDPETLASRMRELSFLNPSTRIHFKVTKNGVPTLAPSEKPSLASQEDGDESGTDDGTDDELKTRQGSNSKASTSGGRSGNQNGATPVPSLQDLALQQQGWQVYHATGGLREYVTWLNRDKTAMHDPITFSKVVDGIRVDVSLQWCSDTFSDTLLGFVNSIRTIDGGTHMDGFKSALTRTINNLARKQKVLKEGDMNLSGDHIREGLGAVVSVFVPNPEFEGQTKTRLGNPEVKKVVESAVSQVVLETLELEPTTFGNIVGKALQAAKAAAAAKRARELVRRKNVLTRSTLPGKLADCTSTDKLSSEIFIVEGDSAGGSAKQARDRRFQAVLPLRGKILNVEKKDDAMLYKNNEISSLIVALGLGVKGDDVTSNLRYNKVILLTDADVDGAHIRTLLLTFLFRYARQLFEEGKVYVGCPPLYKVESGGRSSYCYDDSDLQSTLAAVGSSKYNIQRFKGLGEMMPEQLWQTTLNPESRLLKRLTIEDAAEASHMLTLLMGDKVGPRRALIESYASKMQLDELDI